MLTQAFGERVLAQLHKRELLTDDVVAQILSQDHTGFAVWMGDPLHDKESEQFVARYFERAYDRKLNTILFRAAWSALSQVLGTDERELGAIFTVQTAGEALNYHPHLHGLLADGYWREGIFTRFVC